MLSYILIPNDVQILHISYLLECCRSSQDSMWECPRSSKDYYWQTAETMKSGCDTKSYSVSMADNFVITVGLPMSSKDFLEFSTCGPSATSALINGFLNKLFYFAILSAKYLNLSRHLIVKFFNQSTRYLIIFIITCHIVPQFGHSNVTPR